MISWQISQNIENDDIFIKIDTLTSNANKNTDLSIADWYSEDWLDRILNQISLSFEEACERWRSLYRAAFHQSVAQQRIILDASTMSRDRNTARVLRRESESQLELLTQKMDHLLHQQWERLLEIQEIQTDLMQEMLRKSGANNSRPNEKS